MKVLHELTASARQLSVCWSSAAGNLDGSRSAVDPTFIVLSESADQSISVRVAFLIEVPVLPTAATVMALQAGRHALTLNVTYPAVDNATGMLYPTVHMQVARADEAVQPIAVNVRSSAVGAVT